MVGHICADHFGGNQVDIIKRLEEGNRLFIAKRLREDPAFFEKLAQGQKPKLGVVSCIDSRTAIENVVKARPGEILTLAKTAGGVVYPDGPATVSNIIIGLEELRSIELALINGHYGCGAIFLLEKFDELKSDRLKSHLSLIFPARDFVDNMISKDMLDFESRHKAIVEANVLLSTSKFITIPEVELAIYEQGLKVQPSVFDMSDGVLHFGTPVLKEFNLEQEAIAQFEWLLTKQ